MIQLLAKKIFVFEDHNIFTFAAKVELFACDAFNHSRIMSHIVNLITVIIDFLIELAHLLVQHRELLLRSSVRNIAGNKRIGTDKHDDKKQNAADDLHERSQTPINSTQIHSSTIEQLAQLRNRIYAVVAQIFK